MFTIESVENLVWVDAEKTRFNCLVKYAEFEEKHPSTIDPSDTYSHIIQIWERAKLGEFGDIAEYAPPPVALAPEAQAAVEGAENL
jgi:hypothetical protein